MHITCFISYIAASVIGCQKAFNEEDIFNGLSHALHHVIFLDFKEWVLPVLSKLFIISLFLLPFLAPYLVHHWTLKMLSHLGHPVDTSISYIPKFDREPVGIERVFLDQDRYRKIIDRFTQLGISPVEYHILIDQPLTSMNIFRLVFLDLIRRNIILINPSALLINTDRQDELKSYENHVIQILLTNMNFSNQGLCYSISLSGFIHSFRIKHHQITCASTELKTLVGYFTNKEDHSIKKDALFLKHYFRKQYALQDLQYNINFLKTSYDIFEHYQKHHFINAADLYALASVTPVSHDEVPIETFSHGLSDTIELNKFFYETGYILDVSAAHMDNSASFKLTYESNNEIII